MKYIFQVLYGLVVAALVGVVFAFIMAWLMK
jgi:hypothetical protein